jgi:putative flippase GtrA
MIAAVEARIVILRKAVSFALIGMVNTLFDASVFFLAYVFLTTQAGAMTALAAFADACQCGTVAIVTLVAANVFSWFVAVSGSYAMNSYITFAAESGRKLTLKSYGAFVASGILGVIANTVTLVVVAQYAPVWAAKGCAILVSFVINFSMSHFVVFRAHTRKTDEAS